MEDKKIFRCKYCQFWHYAPFIYCPHCGTVQEEYKEKQINETNNSTETKDVIITLVGAFIGIFGILPLVLLGLLKLWPLYKSYLEFIFRVYFGG